MTSLILFDSHTIFAGLLAVVGIARTPLFDWAKLKWNYPLHCTISLLGRPQPPHLLSSLLGTSAHDYGVYFTEWGRYNYLKHQLVYVQVWYNNRWQFTCWPTGLPGTSLQLLWQHKTQGWESGRDHSPLPVGIFNWKGWVIPPYIQLLVS